MFKKYIVVPMALCIASSVQAIDFSKPLQIGEQCEQSSVFGEYLAPTISKSVSTEFITQSDINQIKADKQAAFEWLSANQGQLKSKSPFHVELNRSELISIGQEVCDDCYELRAESRRVQVGLAREINLAVDFSHANAGLLKSGNTPYMGGVLRQGMNNELVWNTTVSSKDAHGLRIEFADFSMPEGAELYVYSKRGEVFGPYTGSGPNNDGIFWSNTIMGSELTLQLHFFGNLTQSSLDNLGFEIKSIDHMGPRLKIARHIAPDVSGLKSFCSFNESCVENANCGSTNGAVSDARNAVALMIYRSGGGSYICSGGLMADTDNSSTRNLFLTANHCVSKGREANSLEAIFDFETPCNGGCDQYAQNTNTYPIRTNGSSILSTNRTSDYTLLELSQTPGGNRAYLGWTNTPIAFSNNSALYRISHPSGAPQAYSEHSVDTSKGTCSSWPRGNWIYSQDNYGATEGGSSGSPVLNAQGQVVGQLSGGCGTNVNDTCDTANNATVDGALAAYWSSVSEFLDPDNGGGNPGGGDETVSSVSVTLEFRGRRTRAAATVVVVDSSGNPVDGVSVDGSFSGDINANRSGTTNSNGVAVIRSGWTRDAVSSVTYCVDSLNGASASGNTCGNN